MCVRLKYISYADTNYELSKVLNMIEVISININLLWQYFKRLYKVLSVSFVSEILDYVLVNSFQ